MYKVDGIFSNRWAGSGMCYCEHCRTNFKTPPAWICRARTIRRIPARRAYIVWQQQRLFELWRLWDARDPQDQSGGALHPEHGRRRAQRSGHEDASASWRRSCSPTARRAAA